MDRPIGSKKSPQAQRQTGPNSGPNSGPHSGADLGPDVAIRRARPSDRDALVDICLHSAAPDPTGLYTEAELPALIWALPYLALEPDLAFVLTKRDRVMGYCVGTADSARFFDRQCAEWFPDLQSRYAQRRPATPAEDSVLRLIHSPEPPRAEITKRFPAHLHINLMEEARGKARGSHLLRTQLAALHRAGAPGVHIGMNPAFPGSAQFYERHGFVRHWSDDPFAMAQALPASPPQR